MYKYRIDATVTVMRSFEEGQALSITKCTTRRGNQEWYTAAARCEYLFVVVRAALACVGFVKVLTIRAWANVHAIDRRAEERTVAKAAVDILLTMAREFVAARMMYSHGIPFAMAGLLEEDAGLRSRSLAWLKRTAVKL